MKYLLLVTLLVGCGGQITLPDCNIFDAGGLTVCTEKPVSAEEVAEVVRVTESETATRYPQVMGLADMLRMQGVAVYILDVAVMASHCHETGWDDLYTCDEHLNGQSRGSEIIIRWNQCLARTALAHELLHSVQRYFLHSSSDDMVYHQTPWLFGSWGIENGMSGWTIEDRIFDRLILDLPSCL